MGMRIFVLLYACFGCGMRSSICCVLYLYARTAAGSSTIVVASSFRDSFGQAKHTKRVHVAIYGTYLDLKVVPMS